MKKIGQAESVDCIKLEDKIHSPNFLKYAHYGNFNIHLNIKRYNEPWV